VISGANRLLSEVEATIARVPPFSSISSTLKSEWLLVSRTALSV
jgi:hypothetical protein